MLRAAQYLIVSSLAWCVGCGGSAPPDRDSTANQATARQSARTDEPRVFESLEVGESTMPRERFALSVAMITARRLCGTQRLCFEGMTPARCVRELGDAVLAYASDGADLPDPVPAERQSTFASRELRPLTMLVFAQHAEAGQRECGPSDVLEESVVVRPGGCVRLESDTTPCGR